MTLVASGVALFVLQTKFTPHLALGEFILAFAFPLLPALLHRANRSAFGVAWFDSLGWAALAALTWLLYESIAYPVVHGTGDARWYAIMMQDTLLQLREGIFPLFGGQTEYQFNGVLYPIRIAPGIHYLVAGADVLTGHQLEVSAVLNFALVGWAFVAALTATISVRLLRPANPLLSFFLAFFFVSCPGVMSVVYNTDLYMSWVTVPGVPLAWYACVRLRESLNMRHGALLASSLGLLWWGHTPIAVWTTLLVGIALLYAAFRQVLRRPASLLVLLGTGILFLLAAGFPLAAALLFPAEQNSNVGGFQEATPQTILYFLQQVFPKVWLPMNPDLRELSTFQLGYTLWLGTAVLIGGLYWRARLTLAFAFTAVGLLLLLHPHGLNATFWSWVPGFVRNTTGNWPMNRLYLILAGLLIVALPLLLPTRRLKLSVFLPLLVLACVGAGWSFSEGRKFSVISNRLRPSVEVDRRYLSPESINITRFAYLVLGKLPAYFSHGYFDPMMEHRLFDQDGKMILSNESAVLAAAAAGDPRVRKSAELSFQQDPNNPAVWLLAQELVLDPGKYYLLSIDLPETQEMVAILQLAGKRVFAEYQFPVFGETKSYGTPEGAKTLSLRPRGPVPDSVAVRIIVPTEAYLPKLKATHARLLEYDPELLPFRVTSWLPYTVEVNSPQEGWLETPRSFQTHWRTEPSQFALRRSPETLVEIAVPAGKSTVRLVYAVPFSFYLIFWISAGVVTLGLLASWKWPSPASTPLSPSTP